jgi:PelA/Pel-15E family pectate lyase
MKPLVLILLSVAVVLAAAPPVRIALVGDSTVAEDGGWGPGLQASFSPGVETINFARNGRSSKSFREEQLWEPVLLSRPDYVLIQFGHNDGPGKGPERETDAATTFRENMLRYVEEARAGGAKVVLVTSIVRRNFGPDGHFRADTLEPYAASVRALAAAKSIPIIDLYELTRAQAEALGNAGCEARLGATGADGKPDHTHLSMSGQAAIGAVAARELVKLVPALEPHRHDLVSWRDAMRQPKPWYGGPEAVRIANNLLLYQCPNGGWRKNIDMSPPVAGKNLEQLRAASCEGATTIDNGATHTEMRYLARVTAAIGDRRFAGAFLRGLDYLLSAQYPNGGWPQFYPPRHGYWDHITYNDGAMTGVLETLSAVVKDPVFAFVPDDARRRAREALERGIGCILRTQVRQNGRLTAWCAQHDEKTLEPARARSYELPSLSGGESVEIVRFLMSIDRPSPEIVRAVQGAVAWFAASKITGLRLAVEPAPGTPKGADRVVRPDPAAPPLWARFYELGTNRPFFCGRDGVVKYSMAEIEYERRNGYRWYVEEPARLLDQEYPRWRQLWAIGQDVRLGAAPK